MGELLQADRPLRQTLGELTFAASTEGLDPFDAYVRMCEKIGALGLATEDYCSSSITSGGHARDESLDLGEVITKNTDLAMGICDALFAVGQLNPNTAVEAVALGKIRPWKQSDYMTFWLCTMAGLRSRGAGVLQATRDFRKDFETAQRQSSNLDMEVYDSTQPADVRAPHYFKHAELFAATAQQHNARPVRRLVRLVDPDMSLGAQTENIFARLMGTGVFRAAIAQTGIEPSTPGVSPQLIDDTRRLIQFGATVFDTQTREQLVLVPQDV